MAEKGIVYISHLPYGFDKEQLKKYISQFGEILRIKVPRSKKSNRMKGYTFIEFNTNEVASIVANALNNYTMFGRILKARCLKLEELRHNVFKGWNRKTVFKNGPKKFISKYNAPKTTIEKALKVRKLVNAEQRKRDQLKELGIKYEFPGYKAIVKKYE